MSEGLAKEVVWLSGHLTFREVTEVLERVGHLSVSNSQVWRTVQEHGEAIQKVVEDQTIEAQGAAPSTGRMGCSADGGMIHIRGEGWKELKIGDIFEVEYRKEKDAQTGEEMEVGHAVKDSYVAHLGGPEQFGAMLWKEAKRRGWEKARSTAMVADGASWIWNLAHTHFYDSLQLVDWYHATEHLSAAAHTLHGDQPEKVRSWLEKQKTQLYRGHALSIVRTLLDEAEQHPQQAHSLRSEAGYFQNNHRRMQYMFMREQGWPIGSGMVESGCKQFKHRFAGPGMRWSRQGAERLIPIRSAIMSSTFDAVWLRAHSSP